MCLTVSTLLLGACWFFKVRNGVLKPVYPRCLCLFFTCIQVDTCVHFVSEIQSCQMLLNQLREITGIQDPSFLHEALKVSFKASMSQQVLDSCSYHSCVSSSYFYAKMKVHMYRDRRSRAQMTQYLQTIN